jgi:hypothetical protein
MREVMDFPGDPEPGSDILWAALDRDEVRPRQSHRKRATRISGFLGSTLLPLSLVIVTIVASLLAPR